MVEVGQQTLRITLLGPMTVRLSAETPVRVTSKRNALLLGLLAVRPGEQVPRDDLAAAIWPDTDLQTSRRNLRQLVFLLRQFLDAFGEDRLVVLEDSLAIKSDAVCTDLQEFMTHASGENPEDWAAAISVYGGHFLEDADDISIIRQRHELNDLYVATLFNLINHHYALDQFDEAIGLARRAVQADPLDERSRFALVRLLGATRQLTGAKQEYEDLESRMQKELGTKPSVALDRLLRKVKRGQVTEMDEVAAGMEESPKARLAFNPLIIGTLVIVLVAVIGFMLRRKPELSYEGIREGLASVSQQGSTDEAQARRSALFRQLGELAWKDVYGSNEDYWRSELVPQTDRLLQVMEWCAANDPATAVQIGGALERYFLLMNKQGQWGQLLNKALEVAKPERSAFYARAEVALAIALPGTDETELKNRLADALSIYRELGDRFGEAQTIRIQGFIQAHRRRNIESRQFYESALELSRETNNERQVALCLFCLGIIGPDPREEKDQDLARRVQCMIESYDRFRGLSNIWGTRSAAANLAVNAELLAQSGKADQVVRECCKRLIGAAEFEQTLANPVGQFADLAAAVRVSMALGDRHAAAELLARFLTEAFGAGLSSADRVQLSLACYKLDPQFFRQRFKATTPPGGGTPQSPQEIVNSVLK